MPDFYETQDSVMVDENEDFLLEDMQFTIDEFEAMGPEDEALVVEEEPVVVDMIPGSDTMFTEDAPVVEQKAETDWPNDGDHSKFIVYIRDKIAKIPKHSGETIVGCERAKAYLKALDNEISKAMRSDLEGVIDEREIDAIRKEIDKMVERLDKQIKKLRGSKQASLDVRLVSEGFCDKCNASAPMWNDVARDKLVCMSCEAETMKDDDAIEKTAGTAVINVYVSAFERAIVGTMINSKVSAGRNIEETYDRLKNKYNFTPREELAIQQLISDYGYPVYKDRGLLNEPSDSSAGDGVDWQTNYYA